MKHNYFKTVPLALATVAVVATGATLATSDAEARVDGDVITLGAAISLTGKHSSNGLDTQRGYDYAVDTINAAGGVMVGGRSYQLAIKYYDDESTPARGAQLAERLIQQDGVEYMLGPYSSGITKAIAPVTEKFGVPMVEAEGASRSLFTQGYEYLFAVLSTADQYLAEVVTLAANLSDDPSSLRVALAFENDPFSLDVRQGVVDRMAEYGMQLIIDDKLPADLSDMTATLTKVKALRPDVLIISGHAKGAATAARQLEEQQIDVPIIGMTHCESAKIQDNFPRSAEGILCSTQWDEGIPKRDALFGLAADWNAAMKERYPSYTSVPYQAAQASAAVLVWKEGFEAANSFDQDEVRDAIAELELETFFGDIRFAPEGNNIAKPMFLRQIDAQGNYNLVVEPTDVVFPRQPAY